MREVTARDVVVLRPKKRGGALGRLGPRLATAPAGGIAARSFFAHVLPARLLPQRLIQLPRPEEDRLEPLPDLLRFQGLGAHRGVGFEGFHDGVQDRRLQVGGV